MLLVLLLWPIAAMSDQGSLERGIAEYRAENYEEAIAYFTAARKEMPQSSLAAFYLGLAAKQSGNYGEAVRNLQDAVRLSPPVQDAYPDLIEALYTSDQLDEAETRLAEAEKQLVKPAHIAFLKGLVLGKKGDATGALAAFATAKTLDPSVSQVADLQVAMLYAKEKKFQAASASLKAVIAVDPTSELASFAREYESSFSRIIEMYRPWHATVGIAYQFDDNVVAKPSSSIPGVEISGEEDSGFIGTLRFDYNPIMDGPWLFNAQYNLYSITYGSNDTHNTLLQSITLIPGTGLAGGVLTLPVSYSHFFLKEENYLGVVAVRPTYSLAITPSQLCQFSLGYGRRLMFRSPLDPNEDRDADTGIAGAGYIYTFAGGKGAVNLRYEYSQDSTAGRNWDNRGHRFNAGILVPVTRDVSVNFSTDVYLQDYLHTHSTFGVKREDDIYSFSPGLTWEMARWVNFNLNYSFTKAASNIAIYDYRRNAVTAGVEFGF